MITNLKRYTFINNYTVKAKLKSNYNPIRNKNAFTMYMNRGEILIYKNQEGNIKIGVQLEEETVWLSQAQMVQLFGKDRTTVTEHLQSVFKEAELDEEVVCRNFRLTT